ncbi:MAG: DUF2461 domain-containing protein [Candidatus Velthaea sp.]
MSGKEPLEIRPAMRFLRGLRDNNDRSWFAANRAVYDEKLKPQWEDFVAGLLIEGTRFEPRFAYVDPRRCIFRIYRDVRFSNDKAPYKPHLSAFLSPLGWRGNTPGFYVAIEPGGESVMSAGIYVPDKPVLAALRQRFIEGDRAFERIVRAKRFQPYLPMDTDPLKRLPKYVDPGHPNSELIRARRYMVRRRFTDRELAEGNVFGTFRAAIDDAAPFVRWLDQFVSAEEPQIE